MTNGFTNLNNFLFEQLGKINDENLDEKKLQIAITRAEAVTKISETIIKNSELALKTAAVMTRMGLKPNTDQLLLGASNAGETNEKV